MILLPLLFAIVAVNGRCLNDVTIDITKGKLDKATKYFFYNNLVFAPKDYYKQDKKILGCICHIKLCIAKCCPKNQSKNTEQNGTCQNSATTLRDIELYNKDEFRWTTSDFHVVVRNESCEGIVMEPQTFEEDLFYVQEDGQLFIPADSSFVKFKDYCMDYFLPETLTIQAHVCNFVEDSGSPVIYSIGMIISMPFLLATLVIYALLPERNVHAKCLMCYVFSLMCAYLFLVVMQFSGNLSREPCIVLAAFCLYFFMSSFCWMNISCVDIFWTFSGKRGFGLTNKSAERKRILLYCTYTYGLPLLLIGIIIGVNSLEDRSAWYHPNFADKKCWLGAGYPLLIYFYGPMGIMLIFNIVLFVLTALKIRQINNDTAMLNKAESQKHYENNKQTFNLYFKLLLALGINWIMEFISWVVEWSLGSKKLPELWYVTDFCNAIYGLFIFIIFVCKRNILLLLKKRYYICMGQPQKARNLSMRTASYEMSQTEKTVVY